MTSTESRPSLRLLLLALALTLSMTACKTGSAKRELPQLKPEAPLVSCKQPATPLVPVEPKAAQWVSCDPPLGTRSEACRLSQKAVDWIIDLLSVLRVSEGYRAAEHKCLDTLEDKGLIRQ
jgi:hypothetical protein